MIENCQHDEAEPFDEERTAKEFGGGDDDTDLKQTESPKKQAQNDMEGSTQGFNMDQELESDRLMLNIDEALRKIVSILPPKGKKRGLNQRLLPLANVIVD